MFGKNATWYSPQSFLRNPNQNGRRYAIFASTLLSNVSAMLSAGLADCVWEPQRAAELCRYYYEARDAQRSYADITTKFATHNGVMPIITTKPLPCVTGDHIRGGFRLRRTRQVTSCKIPG